MGRIATLWPAGIRSTVVTPSATTMPAGRLERAISTPSSGCKRMTGAGVMVGLLWFLSPLPVLYGERSRNEKFGGGGKALTQTLIRYLRIEAPHHSRCFASAFFYYTRTAAVGR